MQKVKKGLVLLLVALSLLAGVVAVAAEDSTGLDDEPTPPASSVYCGHNCVTPG